MAGHFLLEVSRKGDNSYDKEAEDYPHYRAHILYLLCEYLYKYPGYDTEHDTVRNRAGKWHHGDCHVGSDRIRDISIKLNTAYTLEHEHTDIYEGRSCRK